MRLLLLVIVGVAPATVCLLAGAALGQETQIHSIVAMKTEGGCTSALGFVVESGKDRDAVRKLVEEKTKAKFPQSRNFTHADNFKKDKYLGSHAAVVSAELGKPGCTGRAMGVGFGKDAQEARKDAERLMKKVFPYAGRDIKVEYSQAH